MDLNIFIGIISSAIALAGILVSTYLIYLDSKEFKTISKGRKRTLNGEWTGNSVSFEEYEGIKPTGKLKLNITAKRKKITGLLTVEHSAGPYSRLDHMQIKGGFKMDRFLELNFQNAKDEVMQFGNMIMELDPLGDKMEGRIQGYGPSSKRIMSAEVKLTKVVQQ